MSQPQQQQWSDEQIKKLATLLGLTNADTRTLYRRIQEMKKSQAQQQEQ